MDGKQVVLKRTSIAKALAYYAICILISFVPLFLGNPYAQIAYVFMSTVTIMMFVSVCGVTIVLSKANRLSTETLLKFGVMDIPAWIDALVYSIWALALFDFGLPGMGYLVVMCGVFDGAVRLIVDRVRNIMLNRVLEEQTNAN